MLLPDPERKVGKPRTSKHAHATAFSGRLAELSLPDVLQMLLTLRKTGVLSLEHNRCRATMVIENGLIVACEPWTPAAIESVPTELAARVRGTVADALGAADGTFSFTPGLPRGCAVAPGLSPTEILLDVVRLLDEQGAGRAVSCD